MTRRQRENLYLAFWIGVVSVELAVFAWLTSEALAPGVRTRGSHCQEPPLFEIVR